jgi:hypothetical protein
MFGIGDLSGKLNGDRALHELLHPNIARIRPFLKTLQPR